MKQAIVPSGSGNASCLTHLVNAYVSIVMAGGESCWFRLRATYPTSSFEGWLLYGLLLLDSAEPEVAGT
jgi:hypothetical protein